MRSPRPGRDGRPDKAGSAFLLLWMTVWLSAILVALWTMGGAALAGEPGAAIVLLVWVGAALFGLVSAGRSLRALVVGERRERRPHRDHRWNDGLDEPAPSVPPPPSAGAEETTPPPPPPRSPGRPS